MESQFQKWVNLSYLAVAILLGYIVFAASMQIGGILDLEAKVKNFHLVAQGASLLIGAILFLTLYKHENVNQFMNEVMVELSRVTWPTQKETTSATIIVIVMVLISGMILGLLDYFFTYVIKQII